MPRDKLANRLSRSARVKNQQLALGFANWLRARNLAARRRVASISGQFGVSSIFWELMTSAPRRILGCGSSLRASGKKAQAAIRFAVMIRNLQTMPERRKWPNYFARYGCVICETREVPHYALGMCATCHVRITARLRSILAEDLRAHETANFASHLESTARRAMR